MSPIKAPKRSGIQSQISTAGGAVSNWAPLSRLKNSFSNSAMSVNTPTSGNGLGGVSGFKNKLGTSFTNSRQDISGSNSEITTNKDFHATSNTMNDVNQVEPPDRISRVQSNTSGISNQNNTSTANQNDTIVSNELDGSMTEAALDAENAIDNEDDDDDDPNSAMEFVRGRPLEEELWFHGVLPRGIIIIIFKLNTFTCLLN